MLRRDWLALTQEDVLEPELEICDPHHHLWPEPTLRFPRYDLEDLHVDTGAGHRVVDTVFIDCAASYRSDGPVALRPVGETEFVTKRAVRSEQLEGATIAAIVSFADMTLGNDVAPVLEAHVAAAGGRFRGIRHVGAWDASDAIAASHTNPPPHLYRQDTFRTGLSVLSGMGLSFEAWQYHTQLEEVAELAAAMPDLSIILNHIGAPLGIGPYAGKRAEVDPRWRAGMVRLAEFPNITLKVGGIGMSRFGTDFHTWPAPPTSDQLLERWGDQLRFCIATFGPSRCMFESNFPVDSESCSYTVLWNAFKKVSASYSPQERAELFRGTARRVYRIGPGTA
ncbi:MAG: amidohydrolase family protein [Acidimicrobiales bacterium]